VDGEIVFNPNQEQRKNSRMDVTVAATEQKVVMIEAGAKEVTDAEMVGAIMYGHEEIKKVCAWVEEIAKVAGKPKKEMEFYHIPEELDAAVKEYGYAKLEAALDTFDRQERQVRQAAAEKEIGDLLFAAVNVGRKAGADCEKALKESVERFAARFTLAEEKALADGKIVTSLSEAEWDEYYRKAKKDLQ
jgi:polyribonucleotide nucleotidyltransferase